MEDITEATWKKRRADLLHRCSDTFAFQAAVRHRSGARIRPPWIICTSKFTIQELCAKCPQDAQMQIERSSWRFELVYRVIMRGGPITRVPWAKMYAHNLTRYYPEIERQYLDLLKSLMEASEAVKTLPGEEQMAFLVSPFERLKNKWIEGEKWRAERGIVLKEEPADEESEDTSGIFLKERVNELQEEYWQEES